MNRIVSLPTFLLVLSLGFMLMACKPEERTSNTADRQVTKEVTSSSSDDDWTPGLGMSVGNGRLGIEIVPGLVIDSGGNLGIGIGF